MGIGILVDGEEGEIECHELDNRSQPDHRRPDAHARKAELRDGCVDYPLLPEGLEQPSTYLVRTLIHSDFFTH
jgi:hypothetical protein